MNEKNRLLIVRLTPRQELIDRYKEMLSYQSKFENVKLSV